jgi:hypothetical protein
MTGPIIKALHEVLSARKVYDPRMACEVRPVVAKNMKSKKRHHVEILCSQREKCQL